MRIGELEEQAQLQPMLLGRISPQAREIILVHSEYVIEALVVLVALEHDQRAGVADDPEVGRVGPRQLLGDMPSGLEAGRSIRLTNGDLDALRRLDKLQVVAPRLQVRILVLRLQEPWLGEKETPSSSTGSVSVMTTDCASEGPLLETRIS